MLNIISIETRDIPDAWYQCVYSIISRGHRYKIDRGSYEGQERLEFDYITVHLKYPGIRPLLPDIPPSLGIPNPVADGYLEEYLPYLMTSEKQPAENYCYCNKAEVLTDNGWKLFKDLNKTEKVVTLNSSTNTVEYQKPVKYVEFESKSDLYCLNKYKSTIQFRVNKGHKLYVGVGNTYYRCQKSKFRLIPVEEASKFRFLKFKKNALWQGEERQNFTLPQCNYDNTRYSHFGEERPIEMNKWLLFLGIWLSDGSLRKIPTSKFSYIIIITQCKKHHKEMMKKICDNCGFKTKIYQKDLYICDKQLHTYLKQFGLQKDRFIPQEFMELPTKQLQYLYNGLMLGDGDENGSRYTTNSKKLADGFSELCLKMGKGTSTVFDTSQSKTGFKNNGCYRVGIQNEKVEPIIEHTIHKEDYTGKLYCVQVPRHHIIYVRYNGKAHWSGNTYGQYLESQIEEVIRMYKEDGHGTNQAYMTVGDPESLYLKDPPCLRGIDTRIRYGKLHFMVYFRSWDLWGGFPANLGAIQMLKEYMAQEIGVEDGEIIAASKGLHLYDYIWELAKLRTMQEFPK